MCWYDAGYDAGYDAEQPRKIECYDASERPAFVDFSWTFANPLPVTPKVYKVLKITFSLKIAFPPSISCAYSDARHRA